MDDRKSCFEKVKKILETNPSYRERSGKMKTVCAYWLREFKALNLDTHYMTFLHALADGKLTSSETILRSWRQVMELCKELRGTDYNERIHNQTEQVKSELKEIAQEERKFGNTNLLNYTNIGNDKD